VRAAPQDRPEDYESARGKYIIDAATMRALPASSVVMHPLPRVDEARCLPRRPAQRRHGFQPCGMSTLGSLRARQSSSIGVVCPARQKQKACQGRDCLGCHQAARSGASFNVWLTGATRSGPGFDVVPAGADPAGGGRRPARGLLPAGAQRPVHPDGAAQAGAGGLARAADARPACARMHLRAVGLAARMKRRRLTGWGVGEWQGFGDARFVLQSARAGLHQLAVLCSFVTVALLHPLRGGTPRPAACRCLTGTACEHEVELSQNLESSTARAGHNLAQIAVTRCSALLLHRILQRA